MRADMMLGNSQKLKFQRQINKIINNLYKQTLKKTLTRKCITQGKLFEKFALITCSDILNSYNVRSTIISIFHLS